MAAVSAKTQHCIAQKLFLIRRTYSMGLDMNGRNIRTIDQTAYFPNAQGLSLRCTVQAHAGKKAAMGEIVTNIAAPAAAFISNDTVVGLVMGLTFYHVTFFTAVRLCTLWVNIHSRMITMMLPESWPLALAVQLSSLAVLK